MTIVTTDNMAQLSGQTAVVTGGSNGIGYAICELFSKNGANVAILDLTGAADAASKINSSVAGARSLRLFLST